jgi:hypothetical protein
MNIAVDNQKSPNSEHVGIEIFALLPWLSEPEMSTLYKPEMTETAKPWLDIWNCVHTALLPKARLILSHLGYYSKRDEPKPNDDVELAVEENEELVRIISALTVAAVLSDVMTEGKLVATLQRVAKDPDLFFSNELPAVVQWEIASDYQRDQEKPGRFSLDIWGSTETTFTAYSLEKPTPANIARAADAAANRIQEARTRGRPYNPANRDIAERLGTIFRSSGQQIVRHRKKEVRHDALIYVEYGPFHDFLKLVLEPLQHYLRERGLAPVTFETIVRFATAPLTAK